MLQYLFTGIAGMVLGIVAMRVWQARESSPNQAVTDLAEQGAEQKVEQAPEQRDAEAPSLPLGRKLLLGAGALVLVAAAILILRGEEGSAPPLAAMPGTSTNGQQLDDVDTMIARLAARLEKNPDDGEGFRMLGWSYLMTGKPDKALAPYKRALQLLPNQANVHAGYGEALAGVAGGKVTDDAKAMFDQAIRLDPTEPRARHFQALWLAQHGQAKQALDQWIALANSGPADAPWQADVRRQIDETSQKLGLDVSGRLKTASATTAGALPPPNPAAVAAANALPEGDRQAMINQMVEGLAAKLKANPANPEGWAKLLRSRMVLTQSAQAGKDLATARKALAKDAAGLAQVNAAAREAGVPGA